MAAGRISPPGAKYGPCQDECKHRDCKNSRETSEQPCEVCGEPIGYDKSFYQAENWTKLTHAVCLETQIEEEQRQ